MKKAKVLVGVLFSLVLISFITGFASSNTSDSETGAGNSVTNNNASNSAKASKNSAKNDLTFTLSENVKVETVTFKNQYGITIEADMYMPKEMDESKEYPAIIVGPPYGGVKEQTAGIYAQTMAERGFVSIAFDPSYNGGSGGEPRYVSSPDIFVEDFSAAVDYMGTRSFVDRDKIGVIGVCGSGGFAITAAQVDNRIKAIATVAMYDISRGSRYGLYDSFTEDQRNQMLNQFGEQRWTDFESGETTVMSQYPSEPADTIPEGLDPVGREFFEYYGMERGHHPEAGKRALGSFGFMNFPLMTYIESISPRPILFVTGDHAHSRYFSEDAYKMAAEPKELYVVPNAGHVDLYDKTELIPFDKLQSFFTDNL